MFRRPSDKTQMMEEAEVIQRLQVQQTLIQELRNMIEYQVGGRVDLMIAHRNQCMENTTRVAIISF